MEFNYTFCTEKTQHAGKLQSHHWTPSLGQLDGRYMTKTVKKSFEIKLK